MVAMHDQCSLLDVVATRDDLPLPPVEVVDVCLSDRRLLQWTTSLTKPSPVYTMRTSWPWRHLDTDEFRAALLTHGLTLTLTPWCDCTPVMPKQPRFWISSFPRGPSLVTNDLQTPGLTRSVDWRSAESVSWNAWLALPMSTPQPSPSGQLSAAPIELCSVGSARHSGTSLNRNCSPDGFGRYLVCAGYRRRSCINTARLVSSV